MRFAKLFPLLLAAGCTDNATKEESVQIFAAASSAMTNAQSKAVAEAQGSQLTAPADLVLEYAGPCTLGGTLSVSGSYSGDGSDEAAFDLKTSFADCRELTGTLSGSLAWTSVASGTGFSVTMTGGLDWKGHDGEASCDFDLALTVNDTGVSYGGHLCGHDVRTELVIGGN